MVNKFGWNTFPLEIEQNHFVELLSKTTEQNFLYEFEDLKICLLNREHDKKFSEQNLSQDGIVKVSSFPTMYMYTSVTM